MTICLSAFAPLYDYVRIMQVGEVTLTLDLLREILLMLQVRVKEKEMVRGAKIKSNNNNNNKNTEMKSGRVWKKMIRK